MRSCSITKNLKIVRGSPDDYRQLAHYHYRSGNLVSFAAIFAMRLGNKCIGVIVYSMPSRGVELRSVANGGCFAGFDMATQLSLINKNIRCISRVIVEPRFRGLGLAVRLVRETMPKLNMPIIEALAVMGQINPFFEKAGMTAYRAAEPVRCVRLKEALSATGVEEAELIDPQKVHRKIEKLPGDRVEFINREIGLFLQSYGRRREMKAGLERTRYVLSKLTSRPVYYIWINPGGTKDGWYDAGNRD